MKSKEPYDRARAKEAYRLLGDYVVDLVVATRSWELFETHPVFEKLDDTTKIGLRRMCLTHLVITLFKWAELYDRYQTFIPADLRDDARKLRNELQRRGMRSFRNTVVGHIWDDKLKRPLTADEIEIRLKSVIGESVETFMLWINNPRRNVFPETVVAICERIRDRLAQTKPS